jgi:hypothetical protein
MYELDSLLPLAIVLCIGIFAQAASGFAAGSADRLDADLARLLNS